MSRKSTVGILIAIDVASTQGCDVLSATGVPEMPRWGRREATIVLLKQPNESHDSWRVTTHYGEDAEFDQGFYFGDLAEAQKEYQSRCRRAWFDWAIYEGDNDNGGPSSDEGRE